MQYKKNNILYYCRDAAYLLESSANRLLPLLPILGNPAALYFRAFTNTKLGRYKFARLDYTNLLTIVPGHFEALLGLALLNDLDNRKTEAMDQANMLVEQFPDSAVAYAARAGMELERKQYLLAE